jgi:hypothetical protein
VQLRFDPAPLRIHLLSNTYWRLIHILSNTMHQIDYISQVSIVAHGLLFPNFTNISSLSMGPMSTSLRWSRKLYATNLITHFGAAKIWPRPSPHSFIEQYVLTTHSYIEQYVLTTHSYIGLLQASSFLQQHSYNIYTILFLQMLPYHITDSRGVFSDFCSHYFVMQVVYILDFNPIYE